MNNKTKSGGKIAAFKELLRNLDTPEKITNDYQIDENSN